MKKFSLNKFAWMFVAALVAVALFIVGKDSEAAGAILLNAPIVALTDAEKEGLNESEQKVLQAVKKLTVQLKDDVSKGLISKDELALAIKGVKQEFSEGSIKDIQAEIRELQEIAEKHGTSFNDVLAKINTKEIGTKSIADQLKADYDEIKKIYQARSGVKEYLVSLNKDGQWVMKPFDSMKAAGPHATVDDVGSGDNVTSITQAFDATTILRMGAQAPIVSQFRNVPWVFGLCNLVNVGFEDKFFMWFDEQVKDGASANVAEGGTKPGVQYKYELKSEKYKKEAVLLGFTEEFSLDFARLQDDITSKARIDLINRINSSVIANIKASATAYADGANFQITNPNDYHVIAAMCAQVENNTFALMANTAVMNTRKKYKLGTLVDGQGRWLNVPDVCSHLAFVSNPAVAADDILVGDFKQYNIALRGGMIVRIGYNGTDFAENRFSQVIEQYYFDYISAIRKAAIVKGADFATVKQAITAA